MPVSAGMYYFVHNPDLLQSPPVILVHGAGGNCLSWPPGIRRLSGERVLSVDLPGHGKSNGLGKNSIQEYSDSLVSLMDELKIEKGVVMGHSMGGGIVLQLALDHPERVSGLGLIATGARLPVSKKLIDELAFPSTQSQALHHIIEWSYGPLAGENLKQLGLKKLRETRPAVLSGDLHACETFDVTERLSEIQAPTLVVCGSEDRMTPLHFSTKLAEEIPDAALQIIESTGHMLVAEQPNRLAKIMELFVNSLG